VPRIEQLRDETPPPQAVRLAGTLDTISNSRPDVTLTLEDGSKVPARLEEHDPLVLKEHFGKRVVLSGMAHYRPSGRLLLIEVEWIGSGGEADRFFEAVPVARLPSTSVPSTPQDAYSGVSAFFGIWPGVEDETQLLDALRKIG
jgi:hypothetical protein